LVDSNAPYSTNGIVATCGNGSGGMALVYF
jgi:hypothetical protein